MKYVLLLALLFGCGAPAHAIDNGDCFTKEELKTFQEEYGEEPMFVMSTGRTDIIYEIYVSTTLRTWTWMVTGVDGVSCVADFGTDFEQLAHFPTF